MNRYEFESLISDYIEGELSFNKREEFESYMEADICLLYTSPSPRD